MQAPKWIAWFLLAWSAPLSAVAFASMLTLQAAEEPAPFAVGRPLEHGDLVTLNGHRWAVQNASKAWSIRIASHRANTVVFEVRQGDHIGRVFRNNRSELLLPRGDPMQIIPYDRDFWASGAVAIQGPASAPGVPIVLMQVHDTPDPGALAGKTPPFAMRLSGNDLTLTIKGDPTPSLASDVALKRGQRVALVPDVSRSGLQDPPVFHRWVARMRFSRGSNGALDFWWDGKRIYSGSNLVMGYNNQRGGYFKYGIYRSHASGEQLRVVHANVEISFSSLGSRVARPLPLK